MNKVNLVENPKMTILSFIEEKVKMKWTINHTVSNPVRNSIMKDKFMLNLNSLKEYS